MNMKKIFACITAVVMTAGACSFSAFAEEGIGKQENDNSELYVSNPGGVVAQTYVDEYGNKIDFEPDLIPDTQCASVSQSYYNLYDDNRMTPVRDQGSFGTCWAHAAMACAESSLISKKLANTSIDLSERHLAWFGRGAAPADSFDPLYQEGESLDLNSYMAGGNGELSAIVLSSWTGAALESKVPYDTPLQAVDESYRYDSYAHLQDAYSYSRSDRNAIKKAIIDNGGVYCHFYVSDGPSFTIGEDYIALYQDNFDFANHAVTIVGWDDNFSRTKFKTCGQPSSDGAWLVKNSWGENWGSGDGLFWMSYEEETLGEIWSYNMESADNYDDIYQYDGFTGLSTPMYAEDYCTMANVFTATGTDYLSAVSFWTAGASVPYTIKIYTDVKTDPSTGKCVLVQSGKETYYGYHTVDLKSLVPITKGKKFAVSVSFNEDNAGVYLDEFAYEGQTYRYDRTTKKWVDVCDGYDGWNKNARIKAFTVSKATTLKGTSGIGKTTLSWTAVKGATKYRLQRCASGSSSWSTIAYPTSTSYTDTSVTNGKAYKYRVIAYVGTKSGNPSNAVTLTPVATVGKATLSASAGLSKVALSWTKVTGASKYRLQRCVSGSSSWSTIAYPTGTSYTDSSVTNGTAYKYRILAYVDTTMGAASNTVTATPTATLGTATLSASAGNGKVTLSWTSVTGATKYRLQRCASGSSSWSTIVYPTGTSYTDTSVTNGTTYKYRIFAYAGSAMGSASNTVTVTPIGTIGTASLSGKAGIGEVTLSWTSVTGAAKYRLQRCADGSSSWSTIVYPTGTSYTDTNVTNGTTYKYRIFAYVGSTMGSASNTVTVTPVATVGTTTLTIGKGNDNGSKFVLLSWTEVDGATKYRIQRRENMGSWSTIAYTPESYYSDYSICADITKTYEYRVIAYVGSTMGSPSNIEGTLGTPIISASTGNGEVTLSWTSITGASDYMLCRTDVDSGGFVTFDCLTGTSYTDTSVTVGRTYGYYIIARSDTLSASVSDTVNVTAA